MFNNRELRKMIGKADGMTRRQIVQGLAANCLALNYIQNVSGAQSDTVKKAGGGTAKSVIFIHLRGGMSQVDTFDIKEANKFANDNSEPMKSSADGIRVGKYFKDLSKKMHQFAVINSMAHTQGVHGKGQYLMRTGYVERSTVIHPDLGAWVSKFGQRRSGDIPPFVKVAVKRANLGQGYFSSRYGALTVSEPDKGLPHIKRPKGVSSEQYDRRLKLSNALNQQFKSKVDNLLTEQYHYAYDDALKLMNSSDLNVFDLNQERAETRKAYGDDQFGQSCLLARRLVEKGVNFITLENGGWDDHYAIYDNLPERAAGFDKSVAALMSDLESKGLLDTTLIALTTEFGRSVGASTARAHNPAGYTTLFAGGGIKGGIKHGETDKMGGKAVKDKVSVGDYNATIGYAMGLPVEHVEMVNGRPFKIGNKDGKPLTHLF